MKSLIDNSLKLGFGMMRLPKIGEDIDIETTAKMVDAFLAAGGKYFDTAYIYKGSEEATRAALVERHPRDSYYLATKLNCDEFCCKSREEAVNETAVSLERSGAGYFDFYLLHGLNVDNVKRYEEFGLWDHVKELKERGIIRHYGFSFHDGPEMLEQILTDHPDAEFVQLQINYADWEDVDVRSRACYEVAVKHDIPVIVMEPVKGGLLAAPPASVEAILKKAAPAASNASWAIRYAASLPQVMVVLSGMSDEAQMADNLSFMTDFKPLDEAEKAVVERAREELEKVKRIGCTGCRYCTPGCPRAVQIPEIFALVNEFHLYGNKARLQRDYAWRAGKGGAAADCIACSQCEGACPQHLPIISLLKETLQLVK